MSAKRLAVLVVPVLVLVSSALAQVNEVSITAGRTFVSTQTVPTTVARPPRERGKRRVQLRSLSQER
jgi:hypothetical protein